MELKQEYQNSRIIDSAQVIGNVRQRWKQRVYGWREHQLND